MERGPLLEILRDMVGTDRELSIMFYGKDSELEVMDVLSVERLTSSQGIHLKTFHSENVYPPKCFCGPQLKFLRITTGLPIPVKSPAPKFCKNIRDFTV